MEPVELLLYREDPEELIEKEELPFLSAEPVMGPLPEARHLFREEMVALLEMVVR